MTSDNPMNNFNRDPFGEDNVNTPQQPAQQGFGGQAPQSQQGGFGAQPTQTPQQGFGGQTPQQAPANQQGFGIQPTQQVPQAQQGFGGQPAQQAPVQQTPQQGGFGGTQSAPTQQAPTSQQGFGGTQPTQQAPTGQQGFGGQAPQQTPQQAPAQQTTPAETMSAPVKGVGIGGVLVDEPERVNPIPEPYADVTNGYADQCMYVGQAIINRIRFGDSQVQDGQRTVQFPGDPEHRILIEITYSSMGTVLNDTIVLTLDKTERDGNGNVIKREYSENVAKVANIQMLYLMQQIDPNFNQENAFEIMAQTIKNSNGQVTPQQGTWVINLWRQGEFLKLTPYELSYGGGNFLDYTKEVFDKFSSDPTYPNMATVNAKFISASYRKFQSGNNVGLPYISLTFEVQLDGQAYSIAVKNINVPGNNKKTLKLPAEGTDPNKTISTIYSLAEFLNVPVDPTVTDIEKLIAGMRPERQFKINMNASSQNHSDGTLAFFPVAEIR